MRTEGVIDLQQKMTAIVVIYTNGKSGRFRITKKAKRKRKKKNIVCQMKLL